MKLGCCSWSYHRALESKQINFDDWLRICAEELRVGGVDIIAEQMPKRSKRYLLELKKRCTDLQLSIVSLSPGNNFGIPKASARRDQVASVNKWIEAAYVLGAPCVRIFAGWPPAESRRELWNPMVDCMRSVARKAASLGITLVVEPHNHGGFLPDSRTTLKLIRQLHSPWVRINLDVGNYTDPNPYPGIEASLPFSPHVVAKIKKMDARGEEKMLDYNRIFRMLARTGYHGFVTVEYEGEPDELRSVPKALAMLRRYAAKYRL